MLGDKLRVFVSRISPPLALSVLLSITIRVIKVVKFCRGLTRLRLLSPQHFDHCDDAYSLSMRVQTTLNHIRFVSFYIKTLCHFKVLLKYFTAPPLSKAILFLHAPSPAKFHQLFPFPPLLPHKKWTVPYTSSLAHPETTAGINYNPRQKSWHACPLFSICQGIYQFAPLPPIQCCLS